MSILEVSAADYHADNIADGPTLSATVAAILCTQTPRHAWVEHPKLNPHYVRDDDPKFDVGTVAHAILLEGRHIVEILEYDSFRTKDAQAARDLARFNGKIPLLGKHYDDVMRMVDAVRIQLDGHEADPALFADGKPEQTIVWDDGGVACRSRLDWLRDDHAAVDDFKTTARSASPYAWSRGPMVSSGAYLKAEFYLRGCEAVLGVRPKFRWVVVETAPPFALSVVEPGADVLAVASAQIDGALTTWRRCMATGRWPAYEPVVHRAELPGWVESQWMERRDAA